MRRTDGCVCVKGEMGSWKKDAKSKCRFVQIVWRWPLCWRTTNIECNWLTLVYSCGWCGKSELKVAADSFVFESSRFRHVHSTSMADMPSACRINCTWTRFSDWHRWELSDSVHVLAVTSCFSHWCHSKLYTIYVAWSRDISHADGMDVVQMVILIVQDSFSSHSVSMVSRFNPCMSCLPYSFLRDASIIGQLTFREQKKKKSK